MTFSADDENSILTSKHGALTPSLMQMWTMCCSSLVFEPPAGLFCRIHWGIIHTHTTIFVCIYRALHDTFSQRKVHSAKRGNVLLHFLWRVKSNLKKIKIKNDGATFPEIWEVNNKSSKLSDWMGNWQGLLKLHGSKFPEYTTAAYRQQVYQTLIIT